MVKKDDNYIINEVKTYKNSIYVAVGQVQFYRYNLLEKFSSKIDKDQITLNIVGNFKLPDKFKGFLRSLSINYLDINTFKQALNT